MADCGKNFWLAAKRLPTPGRGLSWIRMKKLFILPIVAAGLLCGCNKSATTQPKPGADTVPAAPAAPAATLPPAAAPAATAPATATEAVNSAASDAASQFLAQAKSASDSTLGSIASELSGKVQALSAAVSGNSDLKSQLSSTLQSLTGGQDSAALGSAFQLSQVAEAAKLTPDQLDLAKQVGNLASAYVVQKDFSSLTGSQSDVATIVTSLRQDNLTAAIPALKNVAGNTSLTDSQKQLISTIADKYAPGWEKVQGAVNTLKQLPGLGK